MERKRLPSRPLVTRFFQWFFIIGGIYFCLMMLYALARS